MAYLKRTKISTILLCFSLIIKRSIWTLNKVANNYYVNGGPRGVLYRSLIRMYTENTMSRTQRFWLSREFIINFKEKVQIFSHLIKQTSQGNLAVLLLQIHKVLYVTNFPLDIGKENLELMVRLALPAAIFLLSLLQSPLEWNLNKNTWKKLC